MPLENVSHTLRMPLIYFEDQFDRVDGQVYEGQLVRVMNEAFTPVTRTQKAELNKAGNRAYMSFVMHDFLPLDLLLGISAGALDRKVGRDQSLFEENDASFNLAKVTPLRWRDHPASVRDDKDVFVARDEAGDVLAVISCDKTE